MDTHTTETSNTAGRPIGYCIFIRTAFEGTVPILRNGDGYPFVYETQLEAERDVAETAIGLLQEFLDGLRDFEEAIEVDEFVVQVTVNPDGSVEDEYGGTYGKKR